MIIFTFELAEENLTGFRLFETGCVSFGTLCSLYSKVIIFFGISVSFGESGYVSVKLFM